MMDWRGCIYGWIEGVKMGKRAEGQKGGMGVGAQQFAPGTPKSARIKAEWQSAKEAYGIFRFTMDDRGAIYRAHDARKIPKFHHITYYNYILSLQPGLFFHKKLQQL